MSDTPKYCPLGVMLTVTDMRRTIAFYRDRLGFELAACWPNEGAPLWANLVLDRQAVMVGLNPDVSKLDEMCGGNEAEIGWHTQRAETFTKNAPGSGVQIYVQVEDVDAYHATIKDRGAEPALEPKTQFYGIRDFGILDPDGYALVFYKPVTLTECLSCDMPLSDAKAGQMYCDYCTNDAGQLGPYE